MALSQPIPQERVSLAGWTATLKQSRLREMLSITARPNVLSFAIGMPASDTFPTRDYARAARKALAHDPRALQYGVPLATLKRHIVDIMARRGVSCRQEQVFLTTGAQQGMSLLVHLLLDARRQVLIEETTYDGLQMAVKPFSPEILTVPTDLETGIDVDAVESLLAKGARPSFIYTIPDGHNPLGVSMSLEKRERLVELARLYRVPIIEDDAYGFLYYETAPGPPMRSMDGDWVFYVGSFSKILAPAIRVGWLVVPDYLIPMLSATKHGSDLDSCTFTQRVLSAYLDEGRLAGHLSRSRVTYATRRDAMLAAMSKLFPSGVSWTKPLSGMFVWVEMPEGLDAGRLLIEAVEKEQVAFSPGQAFCVNNSRSASRCMRLNFSNCAVEEIEDGIARIGRVLRAALV